MAAVIAKAPPLGHDWQDISVLCVHSDVVNYGDGATTVFLLPEDTFILTAGIDVETAFDVPGSVTLTDSAGNTLIKLLSPSMKNAQGYAGGVYRRYANGGSLIITPTATGAASGSVRAWIVYKPRSLYQRYATHG